jgi:acetyl-CoA C-acetyltransferase
MSSHGIKDRVAIVGMGCTRFAEHFDKGLDELLLDATDQAFTSAGVTKDDVDAYWLGTAQSGMSGITLARPLQLHDKPVTRVENYCATGSEALRQAAYAVASGAYDTAMAVGVEKVKDSGYQGLNAFPIPTDGTNRTLTAAAMFSMVAPAYAKRFGVDEAELRKVLARIASKNHANGARNPRAQFRREMSVEQICAMPAVAGGLSVFDCAGVADGSAAAIGPRTRTATATTRSTSRRCRSSPATAAASPTRATTTRPSRRSSPPPRMRTRRRASPTPAPSSPWPRCTTASRRRSSC